MAFLTELKFTGSLGDFTAYTMRGTDKTVIRRKGGASKEKIRTSPRFATARLHMSEFGGCSKMGKEVRFMMAPLKSLADYNFSGFVNKALKTIQKQDPVSDLGRRSILLSKHPKLLEGFSLNKYTTFDSVVRTPPTYSIDRATGTARVEIPRLIRDINFFPNNRHAHFAVEMTLGVVPDFVFNPGTGAYEPPTWYTSQYAAQHTITTWYSALKGCPATTLELALPTMPPESSYSLMLSIGIRFGAVHDDGKIEPVKRAGAAKVLHVVGSEANSMSFNTQDERIAATNFSSDETTTPTDASATAREVAVSPSITSPPTAHTSSFAESNKPAAKSYASREASHGLTIPDDFEPAPGDREAWRIYRLYVLPRLL